MGLTRRSVIHGMGGLASTAALAGCIGDGGDAGEPADVAAFRETITSELAISLERLERRGGTVRLSYRSNHETETESWGYEVGFVSGRFGRFVVDGWDVTRLEGTVTGREGRTLTWELAAETAAAFVNDDITAEAFIDEVFGSMTEA
jgi:hypothetical protein